MSRGAAELTIAWLLAGAAFAAPATARAEDAPARPWYEGITVNGFVSASYNYNLERPPSQRNAYRVFDFADRTFKVDVFELVAQRPVSKPNDTGFRADLALGSSVPLVSSASSVFFFQSHDVDLQQAFASWIAPVGSGLRLDAGKFVTHLGYEVIEGYDGWNDQATRSLLFGFAIPFTHTGLRAGYTFSPHVSGLLLVVNGWDNASDNNTSPSFGAQLALTPAPPATIVLNAISGPERNGDTHDMRTVLDGVATWKASSVWTLGVNGDIGRERNLLFPPADAHWKGIAGYVRFAPSGPFALSLRGESFDDEEGARTGVSQSINEVTLTPEVRLGAGTIARADLRVDHSTAASFSTHDGFGHRQRTILVNVLHHF
jgi:hypothetical protein